MPSSELDDGLLDLLEHGFLPGSNHDGACVGHRDIGHIRYRHVRAIIAHTHGIKDFWIGLAGTDMGESLVKISHGELHFLLSGIKIV